MTVLPTGIGPVTGYQIERSLRFNSADSAYLNRTPASAGNRKTWTWSGWVKRSQLGAINRIFSADDGSASSDQDYNSLFFTSSDQIQFGGNITNFRITTPVYRDISAWYHIVLAVDTTQATAADRFKLYVNGVQVTTFGTSNNPSQNTDLAVNAAIGHYIGSIASGSYFNGYLTEVNFIDGQALTPSSFGETDSATGVWKPKAYTGTYGTNGFFLKFADNSGTTSTTLGKDSSGNGNNWTPNNFSVTAGAGNDSMVDSPTAYGTDTGVGGEVRGNYCTLNPLYNSGGTRTFANGNLEVTGGVINNNSTEFANWTLTSGKWYFEATVGAIGAAGITAVGTNAILYQGSGSFFPSGSGASYTTNDVIGVAVDISAGTVQFYKNGVSQGTVNGTAGASATPAFALGGQTPAPKWIANFGQRAFAYTAPSGFKALCTQNLPPVTIGATSTTQANRYMDIKLYTGNGGQQTQTGLNFQPDFIWVKSRSNAYDNGLANAVTGTGKYLVSNSTAAEVTDASGSIIAFNTDGFGQGGSNPFGANASTYVAWCWRASNTTAVTNTAGSITSTVSANTTSGFSIVTYTGNGSYGATIGHGLGVKPAFMIFKYRGSTVPELPNWYVYHQSYGATKYMYLNTTAAVATSGVFLNDTEPTSSLITLGVAYSTNDASENYVAYCFAPVAGYSAFGSYTGNGSTDGPFVYTGFRPRYLLVKNASNGTADAAWIVIDSARSDYNQAILYLVPNTSGAEASSTGAATDFLSNGFKIRNTSTAMNANTNTIIYAAFAENPFKYSLAR